METVPLRSIKPRAKAKRKRTWILETIAQAEALMKEGKDALVIRGKRAEAVRTEVMHYLQKQGRTDVKVHVSNDPQNMTYFWLTKNNGPTVLP